MPICPSGTGNARPTSGSACATPPSRWREIRVTAGCAVSSCSERVRSVPLRSTPGSRDSACTSSGAKVAVSVLLSAPLLPPRPLEVART